MSESYSNMEFMSTLPKVNNQLGIRQNASAGLTIEQIESEYGRSYMGYLIRARRERYNNREHRHDVMTSDPIARFVTKRFVAEVTAKPFKSYDIDVEGNPEEIMMDFWERWDLLNMNEPLRAIYPNLGGDGYCLGFLYSTINKTVGYKAFGFYECPPEFWKRYNLRLSEFHNVIYEQRIYQVPVPAGYEYLGNYNIHAEEMILYPGQTPGYFHFTRDNWNYGIGVPRIQGIWASLTMLRKISHADYRRSLVFNIFEYPEDMDEEDVLMPMIEATSRVDETNGIAIPKRINPNTQEVEDWPKFYDRTWDTEGGSPRADPSAGGSLLRNAEYARVLIDLGYTETKLVGSQPGEVTGSKLDMTRDDEVDVREFNLLAPHIKWMATWLLENGFLEGLEADTLERVATQQYDIKCHVEWEVLENRVREAELAAEEMEDQAEGQATQNISPYLLVDTRNNTSIMGTRTNVNFPMTEISGGKFVGVQGSDLMVQFPNYPHAGVGYPGGGTYAYHMGTAEAATAAFTEIGVGGGQYIWRELRGYSKGPAYLTGNPTKGGTHQSLVPYDIISGRPSIEVAAGIMQQPIPQILEGPGTSPSQGLTPFTPGATPSQTTTFQTPSKGISYTVGPQISKKAKTKINPKGGGRKKKPGRKKGGTSGGGGTVLATSAVSYVPPQYYNSASMSFSRANGIMKEVRGKGMSKTTWGEMKRFLDIVDKANLFRVNSIDIGNPMNFDIPLYYIQNNKKVAEHSCKREWKKVNKHTGPLYLYSSLEHSGHRENVGSYKYYWDKDKDMPMIHRDYDEDKIRTLHKNWGIETSPILDKLNLNLPLSMSTEYFCGTEKHNGKNYQVNIHNGKGEPILRGIAIVKHGNCDAPFCSFTAEEVNT